MATMIENLRKLNRKERFFLVGMALGNQEFRLSEVFRKELSEKFRVSVVESAFVAMDYHMNWMYAAAALTYEKPLINRIYDNTNKVIDGTQEDVDLVVAFEDQSSLIHLILLEAKGVTAFSNKQFEHKMNRLQSIFGEDGRKWLKVKPYFGLVSPKPPARLIYDVCPQWLKIDNAIPWFEMPIKDRITVFGCDYLGKPDQQRAFWSVN